jgi:tetratricopeptide (TPR) repeat protein
MSPTVGEIDSFFGIGEAKMDNSSDLLTAPQEFLALFKAGKEAARRGNHAKAHELFRKAAEIDPYHEQIWLWLASVVETDEDRLVCFENVLQLNPTNPTARRQLRRLQGKLAAKAMSSRPKSHPYFKRRGYLLGLVIGGLIVVVLIALVVLL